MTTFGFWNIDSLRELDAGMRDLPILAAALASERSLDVLLLIECGIPYEVLRPTFSGEPKYYPISCGERFKVLVRFDPRFIERVSVPVPSDRFDIWHLKLPLQVDILLTAVHGLDKRNNSPAKQELFLRQVLSAVSHFENVAGHDRSIILGDFNANPFEAPIASATGLNAVLSRTVARGEPRRLSSQTFPYFYNPMWNLYGDSPASSAPATYYYRGSDPHELYWHMLDQVLLRPSLLSRFDITGLEIVTEIKGTRLLTTRGIPDRTRFSDHLPVVCEVNLSGEP